MRCTRRRLANTVRRARRSRPRDCQAMVCGSRLIASRTCRTDKRTADDQDGDLGHSRTGGRAGGTSGRAPVPVTDRPAGDSRPRTSRQQYREFVQDYRHRRLDAKVDAMDAALRAAGVTAPAPAMSDTALAPGGTKRRGLGLTPRRRQLLRAYVAWLWPHRFRLALVFGLAVVVATMEMVEPLFMRTIIDKVLLNRALDAATRLGRLNLIGGGFLAFIVFSKLVGVLKDYRQRLLNVRVVLSLRRALYDRMLHLPLPKLWEMKTGGILSRLTGDVETTTGLLQMAIISPALSVIRLVIAM